MAAGSDSARSTTLDAATVQEWLGSHRTWALDGGEIVRTVSCPSFPQAIELVRKVADVAEARDHHPDMDIRWRNVRFALSTHSAGGLTRKDLELAEAIDDLAG